MSADLHIHIRTADVTDDVMRSFCMHAMGSKYFSFEIQDHDEYMASFSVIAGTPNVWVGEVSWLKAALLDDAASFVPQPVANVSALFDEDGTQITESLIDQVRGAFNAANQTDYHIESADRVVEFLEKHKGEKAFTVSW